MIDTLLSYIAPHLCYGCRKLGGLLCDNCKYNIASEDFNICIVCGGVSSLANICTGCKPSYSRAWFVGERADELQKLIDDYKFEHVKAAHKVLAGLLSQKIGLLPSSIVIVPVPTIPSHIRQRGYDHTLLLARHLAKLQGCSYSQLLKRQSFTSQRGASKKIRQQQAAKTFKATQPLKGGTYLVVDDVVTTGATVHYAAKTLLDAGADDVWVAVLARQPIDA